MLQAAASHLAAYFNDDDLIAMHEYMMDATQVLPYVIPYLLTLAVIKYIPQVLIVKCMCDMCLCM